MREVRDPRDMAKSLRAALAAEGIEIGHGRSLDLVAQAEGFRDWNTMAAAMVTRSQDGRASQPVFTETCPIFRSFDEAKAKAFYLYWLGFSIRFEHRFHPAAPLYMGVERPGLILHISEHHGDATPGSTAFVRMRGIEGFHAEIMARPYANNRPDPEDVPRGRQSEVIDPFGNHIRFSEDRPSGEGSVGSPP